MSQTYVPMALRRLVRDRASDCCEYCLIPESLTFAPHCIDHIEAEKHGGKTDADNLAKCCMLCNQKKGSDLSSIDPDTGDVVTLFHPRRQRWSDHFRLDCGRIKPLSPAGRVTVRLLGLNDSERVAERDQHALAGLITAPVQTGNIP